MAKTTTGANGPAKPAGLTFPRTFTKDIPPGGVFTAVEWETRTAAIENTSGESVFKQEDIEVPKAWSQQATNIVADKYFRGNPGTDEREHSVRQLISRVADTITGWGDNGGYFATADDREAFRDELTWLLLHQKAAFNSPVWFNCGYDEHPQVSACFINSVQDTMESILELAKTEGMLFKYGSGTGTNLSPIRSSRETLSRGGTASGPISFMKGYDAFAGVIKSGGACLAPHQMVYTATGPVRIDELAQHDGFVCLSYDPPAGRFKAKRAVAWRSRTKQVLRLRTDKGSFDLSEDHPVRLSTGTYVQVGDLKPGMSLQRCSINYGRGGYVRVNLQDGKKGKELLHRLVASDVMGLAARGESRGSGLVPTRSDFVH